MLFTTTLPASKRPVGPGRIRLTFTVAIDVERGKLLNADWANSVRQMTKRRNHRLWQPQLDPPPLLQDVAVVLVSPKLPVSIGTVARALSCFECCTMRVVAPRCQLLSRAARNSSRGAQYLIYQATLHETLKEALTDCDYSTAFARWAPPGSDMPVLQGIPALQRALAPHLPANPGRQGKVALVFGREEAGLQDTELSQCDSVVSIPIGRLQESLSLSHAVCITLSQLYQARLDAMSAQDTTGASMSAVDGMQDQRRNQYVVQGVQQLADGWKEDGFER